MCGIIWPLKGANKAENVWEIRVYEQTWEMDGKEYREKSYTTETIQWLSLQEKS